MTSKKCHCTGRNIRSTFTHRTFLTLGHFLPQIENSFWHFRNHVAHFLQFAPQFVAHLNYVFHFQLMQFFTESAERLSYRVIIKVKKMYAKKISFGTWNHSYWQTITERVPKWALKFLKSALIILNDALAEYLSQRWDTDIATNWKKLFLN